jgi:hypothetical protein
MQDRRATNRRVPTDDIAIDEASSNEEAAWLRHYLNIADAALFEDEEPPPRRGIFLESGQLRRTKPKTMHASMRL